MSSSPTASSGEVAGDKPKEVPSTDDFLASQKDHNDTSTTSETDNDYTDSNYKESDSDNVSTANNNVPSRVKNYHDRSITPSHQELRFENTSHNSNYDSEASGTMTNAAKTPVRPPMGLRRSHKLKSHSRTSSHTKIILANKSGSGPNQSRPHLNRSMSTDGLPKSRPTALKRNNRSLTKLTTLQPLTRTVSNPSIKTSLRPLTKTMLNQSIKSNRSNTSLKGLVLNNNNIVPLSGLKTSGKKGKAIMKLNDDYKDDEYEDSDSEDSEPDDFSNRAAKTVIPETFELPGIEQPTDIILLMPDLSQTHNVDVGMVQAKSDTDVLTKSQIKQQLENSTQDPVNNGNTVLEPISSRQSSTDDFVSSNMYGGSLLLSQSTGLTKKIDSKAGQGQVYTGVTLNPLSGPRIPTDSSLGSNNSESISGISFKANPTNELASNRDTKNPNLAEPVITNKTVAPPNSYQPNQSIFNNLQRTNSQYLSNKKSQQFHNGTNNFADFLNKSHSNNGHSNAYQNDPANRSTSTEASSHGTRTQKRLWLQRENSLMDVSHNDAYKTLSSVSLNKMMFGNYNQSATNLRDYPTPNPIMTSNGSSLVVTPGGASDSNSSSINNLNGLLMATQNRHQNLLQSRTEFERLNREYLNVRRHLNPVAESLNRVEKIVSSNKELQIPKTKSKRNATSTLSSISMHGEHKNANNFKEFSPVYQEKESEIANTLETMWKDALIQYSSVKLPIQQQMVPAQQPAKQITQQSISRQDPRGSYEQTQYGNSVRSVQPTTRKLAAQAAAQQRQQQGQQLFIRGE